MVNPIFDTINFLFETIVKNRVDKPTRIIFVEDQLNINVLNPNYKNYEEVFKDHSMIFLILIQVVRHKIEAMQYSLDENLKFDIHNDPNANKIYNTISFLSDSLNIVSDNSNTNEKVISFRKKVLNNAFVRFKSFFKENYNVELTCVPFNKELEYLIRDYEDDIHIVLNIDIIPSCVDIEFKTTNKNILVSKCSFENEIIKYRKMFE